MENEKIIISLTTWSERICNIPTILDRIYKQTVLPDKVVLNLSYEEVIPIDIQKYIESHNIEVYRTEDTKVYKKFLHTLKRYPNDCVINIDDDLLYPLDMIEDLWESHKLHPNNPICGNHKFLYDHFCHCGEASLTKYCFFKEYLECIDTDVMNNCSSSDIVYTYFATKANHPYVPAKKYYGNGYVESYNPSSPYTQNVIGSNGVTDSFNYLVNRFGDLPSFYKSFQIDDNIVNAIEEKFKNDYADVVKKEIEKITSSYSFRIGNYIVRKFSFLQNLINPKRIN